MRFIPLAILSTLVGVTYWIGATLFTAKIEQDITTRTNTAISSYKPAVDLEVDGRDVTLTGFVKDEAGREAALDTVDSVYGVRATRDSLAVMSPYNVHAKYDNGRQFFIDGNVDDEQAQYDFENTIDPLEAVTQLNIGARPLVNSGAKIALAAGAVAMMDQGELWIDEDHMRITGEAPDQATKARIEQHLRDQQALIDPLQLTTQINAPAPAEIPAYVEAPTFSDNCQYLATNGSTNETVLFDIDQSYIRDIYKAPLARLIDLVNECGPYTEGNVIVEAHADKDGSEDYNYALSQRRANEVTQLLMQQGLDSKHIASFAFGETRPVSSNETRDEKSFNRRVEVRFLNDTVKDSHSLNHTIISTQSSE